MPHLLTPFIRKQRLKTAAPYFRGEVLDVGCGFAHASEFLLPGQVYVGIEGSDSFVQWLEQHRGRYQFFKRDLDREHLNLERQFDTILLLAVIEHLENPAFLLRQIPEHLKPSGRLVITTPSPVGDIIHRTGARLGLFSQHAADEHEQIFSQSDLEQIAAESGLRVIHYEKFLFGGNQLCICEAAV